MVDRRAAEILDSTRGISRTEELNVADLIAIGYQDETTAIQAAAEAERLAHELIIQPDAIAAIVCDKQG